MSRFSTFSQATAPILLGKQMVKFSPADIAYVEKSGFFPEGSDKRGDYMHMQFVLSNGATTASYQEDKMERNPKYLDNIKLYFDGKIPGDGFMLRLTFEEIRKRDKRYANMTAEQILGDLLYKEFPVWFYRYYSNGKGYLQVAWTAEEYKKRVGGDSKPRQKTKVVEEALPMDI
jgi:hypothetical protein